MWALSQISEKGSTRAFSNSAELFTLIFTDSEIAKKFQMHKDKISYVMSHGLGPFFQRNLSSTVKQCSEYIVSFDECLNKVIQKG